MCRRQHLVRLAILLLLLPWAACAGRTPAPDPAPTSTAGPPTAEPSPAEEGIAELPVDPRGRLVLPPVIDVAAARRAAEEARSLRLDGRENAAAETLLRALGASGLDAEGLALLAALAEREGFADQALAARRTALEREPSAEQHRRLAALLSRLGRRAEAADAWQRAVDAEPSPEARARLAVARHYAGLEVDPELAADAPGVLRAMRLDGAPPRARIQTASSARRGAALGPEVRIDSGGTTEAAELSMVAWQDQLTVAWNDLRDATSKAGEWRIGVGTSSDGGASWSDHLLRPLDPSPQAFEGDPMTAVDPTTGHRWVGGIEFGGAGSVYVAHQHPDGTFDPPVELHQGATDKCWMGAGPAPGAPGAVRVYVAYNFPNSLHRSADLGATWSAPVTIDEGGIGFLPRVTPDGTLHLGYADFEGFVFGTGIQLQTSIDGGASVGPRTTPAERMDVWDISDSSRFPGGFRVAPLPILAAASDDELYFAYMDTTSVEGDEADVDVYLVRSTNGGASWQTPTIVAGGPGVDGDQFLPWLEVDAGGRLHLAYFDTRHAPQSDTDPDALLDVYYATSGDGGQSWTETRITDEPFSTAGVSWPGLGQFIGDYLAVAASESGVWVAYPRVDGVGGDLDLFIRRIEPALFTDGFESGDATAWSSKVP